MTARLGKPEELPSVAETKRLISKQLSTLFKRYNNELNEQHQKNMQPLLHSKRAMTKQHRSVRKKLAAFQKQRWQTEELKRSRRVRRGFKGLWDKISGKYSKIKRRNEQETKKSYRRDQNQREELTQEQLTERQILQKQINLSREKNHQERKKLIRELSHVTKHHPAKDKSTREKEIERDDPDIGFDFEPEI